jgi:hypothetical protein
MLKVRTNSFLIRANVSAQDCRLWFLAPKHQETEVGDPGAAFTVALRRNYQEYPMPTLPA